MRLAFFYPAFALLFWAAIGKAAILFPPAPAAGQSLVTSHIDYSFLEAAPAETLSIIDPHREYFVGLTNLAAGKLLPAVRIGGWRYLLVQKNNAVGAAVLDVDEKTENGLRFNSIQKTWLADETLKGLGLAGELPQIKKADYEFRYLNIPSLAFVALWFHGQSDDILVPLFPTIGKLKANQGYTERQIIRVLKPYAQRTMKTWENFGLQEQQNVIAYKQAMMDYELAHGGKCGDISAISLSAPLQEVKPQVRIYRLQGFFAGFGYQNYRVKITYEDEACSIVKWVEVMEKLTH